MIEYGNYGRTLGGLPCVSIRDDGPYHNLPVEWDDSLIGVRGEIWPDHAGGYKAVVFGPVSDKIFSFEKQVLKKWRDRLDVPFRVEEQIALSKSRKRAVKAKSGGSI